MSCLLVTLTKTLNESKQCRVHHICDGDADVNSVRYSGGDRTKYCFREG